MQEKTRMLSPTILYPVQVRHVAPWPVPRRGRHQLLSWLQHGPLPGQAQGEQYCRVNCEPTYTVMGVHPLYTQTQ